MSLSQWSLRHARCSNMLVCNRVNGGRHDRGRPAWPASTTVAGADARPTWSSRRSTAQVVTLALPPGARLSEAEVARAAGVSRQPVRDAFWRLSQLGFLTIRPQRSTEVSVISEQAVHAGALRAHGARGRDDAARGRAASERRSSPRWTAILDAQAAAVAADDRERFHALDDEFHRRICALLGARLRLVADPREEGAHGPGAASEPELRRPAGARRPPGRSSTRCGTATSRGAVGGDAHASRADRGASWRAFASSMASSLRRAGEGGCDGGILTLPRSLRALRGGTRGCLLALDQPIRLMEPTKTTSLRRLPEKRAG